MPNCSDIQNPLVRDGRNQDQREQRALSPDYIKVDERTVADFLVFAHAYAKQIQYYDQDDQKAGDWVDFFSSVSIQIARISKAELKPFQTEYSKYRNKLAHDPQVNELLELFELVLSLPRQLDDWLKLLNPSTPLFNILKNLIQTNLTYAFEQLIAYMKGGANRFDYRFEYEWIQDFDESWFLKKAGSITILPDNAIYGKSIIEEEQIEAVLPALDDVYQIFIKANQEIIALAPTHLLDSLKANQEQEPHLSLFLTFLKLYQHVQEDLNLMTDRHLNFFFKDVLKLDLKQPIPDKAHLIFQLPEGLASHKLDQNLSFTAGDDQNGVELLYKLEDTLIANQAQIASFRSLFVDYHPSETDESDRLIKGIHAAPIANSADGLGAEIKGTEVPSWATLGSPDMPVTDVGFAIASESLLLAEENREIRLEVNLSSESSLNLHQFQSQIVLNKTILEQIKKAEGLPYANETDLIPIFQEAIGDGEKRISTYEEFLKYVEETAEQGGFVLPPHIPISHFVFLFLRHSVGASPFFCQLSSEKGWFSPSTLLVESGNNQLVFRVFLGPDDPAIVRVDPEVHLTAYPANFPVWEVKLHTDFQLSASDLASHAYELLKQATWQTGKMTVKVDKVLSLLAQNDESELDTSKPFFPFGSAPKIGSNVYLGSNEIFRKKLTDLQVQIDWEAPPADFAKHYEIYPNATTISHDSFKVDVSILKHKQWETVQSNLSLFNNDTDTTRTLDLLPGDQFFDGVEDAPDVEALIVSTQQNFMRLELTNQDFFHRDFLPLFVLQNTALAKHPDNLVIGAWYFGKKAGENTATLFKYDGSQDTKTTVNNSITTVIQADIKTWEVAIPNDPYTPIINKLSLSYTTEISHSEWTAFHLHPFDGYEQVHVDNTPFFLPVYEEEGALLLGIRNLSPNSVLPILYQIAEGSANPDIKKAEVLWSHLQDNRWVPFEDFELLSDESNGLIESGIVQLEIPDEGPSQNTILPKDLYWIKASVMERSAAISELIAAHTQSARVIFSDQDNDPAHLEKPFPAESITDLVATDPLVEAITQPYDSFDGRALEKKEVFYTRVSERLRHKGRSITIFDYERIILEAFPEIYKVKCINHTKIDRELVPGHITIALIPNLAHKKAVDRLQPKVSINILEEINAYLQKICSPFVTLHVVNPNYERVSVSCKVKFRPGKSKGFYKKYLEEAILRYLSPWAFAEGNDIVFGGRIFRSSILNFVEEQSYVDYVSDFDMYHNDKPENVNEITSTSARSILASGTHTMLDIEETSKTLSPQTGKGLGYMRIHKDFSIKQDQK